MDDLIEALTLMATKSKPEFPTHCEHDTLTVCVDPALFTAEELVRLDELGFFPDSEEQDSGCFISFKFGSA